MVHEDDLALFERSDWTSSKLTRCDWLNGHRELRTVTVPRILTHFRGESGGQKTEREKREKENSTRRAKRRTRMRDKGRHYFHGQPCVTISIYKADHMHICKLAKLMVA